MKHTFKLAEQYLETFHSHGFSKLLGEKSTESRGWKINLWKCSSTSSGWSRAGRQKLLQFTKEDFLCTEEHNSQVHRKVLDAQS